MCIYSLFHIVIHISTGLYIILHISVKLQTWDKGNNSLHCTVTDHRTTVDMHVCVSIIKFVTGKIVIRFKYRLDSDAMRGT